MSPKPLSKQSFPADQIMAIEVFSELLTAVEPRHLGQKMTEQLRELSGARTAMLVAHLKDGNEHKPISVCPQRRTELFSNKDLAQFYPMVMDGVIPRLTNNMPSGHQLRALMEREHISNFLYFPLYVMGELLGTLLLLELPDINRIEETEKIIKHLLPLLALALRNSLSYDKINQQAQELDAYSRDLERRVAARTEELETINSKLLTEINERKQVEDLLLKAKENAEAANIAKSTFLNNIAHDFRTPTHAIMGFSAFLLKEQLTEKQINFVHIINERSRVLLNLVEELLDVSRLDSGRLTLRAIQFDLEQCVRSSFDIASNLLFVKNVKMSCSVPDGLPQLKGDPTRLGQILTNLIENAVKYTDKGEISVQVQQVTDGCPYGKFRTMISVKDTGLGIEADQRSQIFDAFSRFHEFAGDKPRGGVGLGLYITRTLVDLMGGTITVVSEVGTGSEFMVTLDFDIA